MTPIDLTPRPFNSEPKALQQEWPTGFSKAFLMPFVAYVFHDSNHHELMTEAFHPWFTRIAEKVFGDYMRSLGTESPIRNKTGTTVRFEGDGWYTEVIVFPEDGPNYCPRVMIGALPEIVWDPRDKQVDILHTLPNQSPLRRYTLEWRYSDPNQMEEAFQRVKDEIFKPYAEEYLANAQRLRSLIGARSGKIHEESEAEIDSHNDAVHRRNAEKAFKSRDYLAFIDEMGQIPSDRHSRINRERLKYATKQTHHR